MAASPAIPARRFSIFRICGMFCLMSGDDMGSNDSIRLKESSGMRRGLKETAALSPLNRFLQNGYRESIGMESGRLTDLPAVEWTRGRPQSNRK
jgi:hypothetical protein